MPISRHWTLVAGLVGAIAATALPAVAQDKYPSRRITIIAPFTPGSGVDIVSREIATELSAKFGQSVIVENRTGAGGSIGASAVARSAPDGYTILATPPAVLQEKHLKLTPLFDPEKDLIPITIAATTPVGVVTSGNGPFNSFKALLDYAYANPGKMNYASAGAGSSSHLQTELMLSITKAKMVAVPYPGAPEVWAALAQNNAQFVMIPISSLPGGIENKTLRVVAVGSAKRVAALPDIPSISETVPGFAVYNFWGIFAPAGTPPEIVETLNKTINEFTNRPDVKERWAKRYDFVENFSVEQSKAFIAQQAAIAAQMAAAANIVKQ